MPAKKAGGQGEIDFFIEHAWPSGVNLWMNPTLVHQPKPKPKPKPEPKPNLEPNLKPYPKPQPKPDLKSHNIYPTL